MKIINGVFAVLVFCLTFVSSSNAQTNNSNKTHEKDRPLEIKSKPHPSARGCQGSGVVRVIATFDKSGEVTQVEMGKASSYVIINQNAFEAAKKIKFKPATEDGEAITVTKLVEYSFSIY